MAPPSVNEALHFPDGSSLGDGHRRTPVWGRQLEQRLVGVRAQARPRRARSRAHGHRALQAVGTRATSRSWRVLGFKTYRFSVEWSRIEPVEGEFDQAQLDHYRQDGPTSAARAGSSRWSPSITSTLPQWLGRARRLACALELPTLFERFTRRVTAALGDPGRVVLHDQRARHGSPRRLRRRVLPSRRDSPAWTTGKAAIANLVKAPQALPSRPSKEIVPQREGRPDQRHAGMGVECGRRPIMKYAPPHGRGLLPRGRGRRRLHRRPDVQSSQVRDAPE